MGPDLPPRVTDAVLSKHCSTFAPTLAASEGGMIRLETLIDPKFLNSSFSILLKLDKQFPVEQFEATVSQSTVHTHMYVCIYIYIHISIYLSLYLYIYI